MKRSDLNKRKNRIRVVGGFFFLFLGLISVRAIYIQVFQCTQLSEQAANQYQKSLTAKGRRGTIFDVNYREMAITVDVTSIAAYPNYIRNPQKTAEALSGPLNLSKNAILRKLNSDKLFVWIKRQVLPREAKAVRMLKLEGVDFIPEHKRFYPGKTLASQLVGFTGIDGHGLEGLEYFYDDYLDGEAAKLTVLKDALGRWFEIENDVSADTAGYDIVLTIDRAVQYIAENALEKAAIDAEAKSGMVVVSKPRTGEIMAIAHYPFFNPNAFQKYNRQLWRNRAITDPFEPGSTMKIFSAAAAIESGNCTPNTIFYCENGAYRIGEDVVHDTGSYGWMTLLKIVKHSSNIGAVKISEMIGPKSLYSTLRSFGFGSRTGIGCPGETSGSLSSYKRWSKIDAGAISFGHGISVSSIQLLSAVGAIANDGVLMRPYIVQAVQDENGNIINRNEPQKIRRVISKDTARTVKMMMETVIEGGTGSQAKLDGYTACGKTGTAQKIDKNGEYAPGKCVASFVGFAPAKEPEIAILVVLDEPQTNYYGGVVAAPVFKEVAEETLNYLNIPPAMDKLTVSRENGISG